MTISPIEQFARVADAQPAHDAVSTAERSISYGELYAQARRIAGGLIGLGVRPGDRIGLFFERELDGLAALLGVLAAGATVVPLLSSHPAGRLRQIVHDAEARIVIAPLDDPGTAATLGAAAIGVAALRAAVPLAAPPRIDLQAPAMIFYTAGTSGESKGVAKSHRVLASSYRRAQEALGIGAGDRVALFSTFGMGQGATAIMTTLLHGATLCPFDVRHEGLARVTAWLADGRVSIWISSATLMRSLGRAVAVSATFPRVRVVRLSGERVRPSDIAAVSQRFPTARIVVTYNSTETGLITFHEVDRQEAYENGVVPVGRPASGMAVEIVGERGDTLGRGIEGEIVVRSADIAEGYWRDPERTAALFEQNPANPAERAYRTGDLGRWRHDGALEHLGRKDLRVKIRGFRVELEEIESVLTQEPAVVNAAAAAMPGADGDLRLVAYVQLAAGSETSVEMLRARLAARLPAHMIPSAFVFLDELPVGPTGKIARQQLPDPPLERPALDAGFARPRNAREESIAETWREVLGLDQVGVHDGFLALGGDSLKATLVATRLSAKFGRDIPLTTLFDASTIAELAAAIDALPSH